MENLRHGFMAFSDWLLSSTVLNTMSVLMASASIVFAVLIVQQLIQFRKQDKEEETMPRKFIYIDRKNGDVLFETVEENYVSFESADKKMLEKTKRDPRLDPNVERHIYVVRPDQPSKGRYDKNKKTDGFV